MFKMKPNILKKLKSRNNERGVVYVTVVMIIMVLTVLALSVVGLNANQSILAEKEIKRIQAEQSVFQVLDLQKNFFLNANPPQPKLTMAGQVEVDNFFFNTSSSCETPHSGSTHPNGTDLCQVIISW